MSSKRRPLGVRLTVDVEEIHAPRGTVWWGRGSAGTIRNRGGGKPLSARIPRARLPTPGSRTLCRVLLSVRLNEWGSGESAT
jgi:hypothetical protein